MSRLQGHDVRWKTVPTGTITAGWGAKQPADLSRIYQPVLVANGDSDRMVPSINTRDLARRLPNSELVIYPDSGHGAVFQFHADFVLKALEFLARPQTPKAMDT